MRPSEIGESSEDDRRARIALDSVNEAILILEPNSGRIIYGNRQFWALFGGSPGAPGNRTLIDLVADSRSFSKKVALADYVGLQKPLISEQDSRMIEWEFEAQSGRRFWAEVCFQPAHLGGELRLVASLRDISARMGAEEELHRIRAAVEDSASAIVITDRAGDSTYFNTSFGQLFGFTDAQRGSVSFASLLRADEEPASILASILAGKAWKGEVHAADRSGRQFLADLRGTPVFSGAFETLGGLFFFEDITEQKKFEAEFAQAQKMRSIGQLAAGIAHEINSPLQFLGDNARFLRESFGELVRLVDAYQGCVNVLEKAEGEDAAMTRLRDAVDEVDWDYLREEIPLSIAQSLDGVARVSEIVKAMRQFAHPGSEEMKQTDLNQAIESAVTISRNEWRYVAETVLDLDRTVQPISCFPADLNQVLLNLIINASHAIEDVVGPEPEEKGRITISTSHGEGWAEIRVSDTGSGMPEEVRERIFEPFFTTKEVGKGTGQGLAICHSVIVEKHGGALSCETAPNKGCTFIIRLPGRASEDAAARPGNSNHGDG